MAIDDFKIVNDNNGFEYNFKTVAPVSNAKRQPVTSIPLIGGSPDDTFLFRVTGQSETFSMNFIIFDDGENTASSGSSVVSVDDQIVYLRDNIYTSEPQTSWTLYNDRYYPDGVTVVITDLQFDNDAGGANFVTGKISFQRGKINPLK